jgi:hypothetical protein
MGGRGQTRGDATEAHGNHGGMAGRREVQELEVRGEVATSASQGGITSEWHSI